MTESNCSSSSDDDDRGDTEFLERYPNCSTECGRPAVVRGVAVVDEEVVPNTAFCSECFTPVSEVELPEEVDREDVATVYSDSLIVTPADTVIQSGKVTIVEHGPGSESRVVLG